MSSPVQENITISNVGSTYADVFRDIVGWARQEHSNFVPTIVELAVVAIIVAWCVLRMFSGKILSAKEAYHETRKKVAAIKDILIKLD